MEWIVTDDIFKEAWRRLLELANSELAIDLIELHHGRASKSEISNYKKQAKQIRATILQAKEYFEAANNSSLFTSPNHLYYGIVALASAMMLILGDGSKSLDMLRKDPKNGHHGLLFSMNCNTSQAGVDLNLIKNTFVEVCSHGHFMNWYSTLPAFVNDSAIIIREKRGTVSRSMGYVGASEKVPPSSLAKQKSNLIDIFRYLPDLRDDLNRYKIDVASSRARHEYHYDKEGNSTQKWNLFNASTAAALEQILFQFTIDSRFIGSMTFKGGEKSGVVIVKQDKDEDFSWSWPDSRQTIFNDTICYAATLKHEIVDAYLASYQLSMLSRYFPDIWIGCLESQCRAAKLIERVVDILIKKFPILVLSELNPKGLIISNNHALWRRG